MGQTQRALGPAPARVRWVVEEEEKECAERRKPPGEGGSWAGSRAGREGNGRYCSLCPPSRKWSKTFCLLLYVFASCYIKENQL